MRDQNIQFPVNGGQGMGYLVRPDSDEAMPAVVVIQEWWGLNEHIRDVVRRVSAAGFVALAPDLYHGEIFTEPNDAQKKAMELDRPRALQEISAAVAFLEAQTYVAPKKIGVMGFCMGGALTLFTAAYDQNVGAAVAFYGGGAPDADAFAKREVALLNIVGEKDTRVLELIRKLDDGLKHYALPHELVVYPGGEHAFFNDTRKEVYNSVAAGDAWGRAMGWFRTYLKS